MDGRRTRWDTHRQNRRAEIVEAALRAIAVHGAAASMTEIAAEAGVTKPVLYRHFADQADLFHEVGKRAATRVVSRVTDTLDADIREPRELAATVIDTYLRQIAAEPELYRFVVRRAFADNAEDPVAGYRQVIAGHLSAVIADRLSLVDVEAAGAEAWAHGIVGMVQAVGDWWLDQRSIERTELTWYLTALLWNGFAGIFTGAGIKRPAPNVRSLRVVGKIYGVSEA